MSKNSEHLNPLMHNVPKWSDTLLKSWNNCYKIFKVCLTILGHYALKGEELTDSNLIYQKKKKERKKETQMIATRLKIQ